jgi:hypothetical protein
VSRTQADFGPPGPIPGDHSGLLKVYLDDRRRPGGVAGPHNGKPGAEVLVRFAEGGVIGGGPTRPKTRKRRKA